jgi:hypothetical protein
MVDPFGLNVMVEALAVPDVRVPSALDGLILNLGGGVGSVYLSLDVLGVVGWLAPVMRKKLKQTPPGFRHGGVCHSGLRIRGKAFVSQCEI